MMKIGTDQKNCICQKGRSRRVGQTGCRGIIGIKTEQRAEYAICFVAVLVIKVEGYGKINAADGLEQLEHIW